MTDPAPIFRYGGVVKICGLRESAHAIAAVEAGADLLGFVFASTRRQIAPELAAEIVRIVRERTANPVLCVGLFVNDTPDRINRIVDEVGLDLVQLHGEISAQSLEHIRRPAIISIRPQNDEATDRVRTLLRTWMAASVPPVGFVIDGYHPTEYGGQGIRADWQLAATLAQEWPLLLAGGLDQHNVGQAIQAVSPLGVDVSSGIETNGVKDIEKIRQFIAAAREGFAASSERHVPEK